MINLIYKPTVDYAGIQETILGYIEARLAPGEFTRSPAWRPDRLNFALFVTIKTDVLMSHGLADKNYFFRKDPQGRRYANELQHAFVPGPWLRRSILKSKHLTLTPEQVHCVGWPRLDHLLRLSASAQPQEERSGRVRVLWAPTHDFARRGEELVSLSSYPEFEAYAPTLGAGTELRVSLHPRNRGEKRPTLEDLVWADCVISDFGTLVYEAWALGKPVIFPHWIIGDRIKAYLPRRTAERHIYEHQIGLHARSFQELRQMVHERAPIGPDVAAFLADYLDPSYAGRSSERVACLLRQIAGA